MFCCGCLNTEAKLRSLDENLSRALREFLGLKPLQVPDRFLHEYICWTCYVGFMKSIKFKEQCLKARNMVLGMLNVSRESLNTSHMLNFKPNLTQSKVVLTNVGPALETNEDSFFPIIQEIKSEVLDEDTFTDVNETSCNVKINFSEDNKLSNEYGLEDCKDFTQDDEIEPGTISFMTDKELKEEIVVKEGN
ncbi:hypothetical protein K1T71_000816 [Dendrolimus kikuchii]|uniref:Uncharacterized protein n=1 Tax=Dendrolimus kikuchii TaxID=765133 RepID=A0ACC1DKT1_9NEOP|nr:hypothetical protein K1T71_000816 [Dendrolimus kikuchii]